MLKVIHKYMYENYYITVLQFECTKIVVRVLTHTVHNPRRSALCVKTLTTILTWHTQIVNTIIIIMLTVF